MKKRSSWLYVLGLLIVLGLVAWISYVIGQQQANTVLDGKKVKIEQLQAEEQSLEDKVDTINTTYNDLEAEVDNAREQLQEYEEATGELSAAKEKTADQKTKTTALKEKNKVLQQQIDDKKKEIDQKKNELATLSGNIKQQKAKPITLPGGHFTVGEDLPAGRYKISTTTNSMNYFVNDGEVNIILGTDSGFAEPTYTLELVDGDEIEQHSSVTYTRL